MNIPQQLRFVFFIWSFPGVVIHELAHAEFCRYYKIPVKETCYFQIDDPPGYVVHARPKKYIISFMISVAPAIVNTFIAFLGGVVFAVLILPYHGPHVLFEYPRSHAVAGILAAWVGISSGVHALPSKQDASEIWNQSLRNWYNPLVIAVVPLVLIIEILNRLRFLKLHIVAGGGVFMIGVFVGSNPDVVVEYLSVYLGDYDFVNIF